MKKRLLSMTLAVLFSLSLCSGAALAVEPRASLTLSAYTAIATVGNKEGEVKFSYDVKANASADEVGISSVKIYKADGTYVTTIPGTVKNGLIITGTTRHASIYTYKGTSGVSYYAVMTAYAKIGSNSDTRTMTTNSAIAR